MFGLPTLFYGCMEVLFPTICVCCDRRLAEGEISLCGFCKLYRFEPADSRTEGLRQELLPDHLLFRQALWQLTSGSDLQNLLHQLKYGHLYELGVDLGRELGRVVQPLAASQGCGFSFEPILVPVPLHRSRYRERGYNQAAAIGEGVSRATGWSILPEGRIIRRRATLSQTGLSLNERVDNVKGVFDTGDLAFTPYELPVVIDDVFTTGATTMELCMALRAAGANRAAIATVAEA